MRSAGIQKSIHVQVLQHGGDTEVISRDKTQLGLPLHSAFTIDFYSTSSLQKKERYYFYLVIWKDQCLASPWSMVNSS